MKCTLSKSICSLNEKNETSSPILSINRHCRSWDATWFCQEMLPYWLGAYGFQKICDSPVEQNMGGIIFNLQCPGYSKLSLFLLNISLVWQIKNRSQTHCLHQSTISILSQVTFCSTTKVLVGQNTIFSFKKQKGVRGLLIFKCRIVRFGWT